MTRYRSAAMASLSLAIVLAVGTAARGQFYAEKYKLTAADGDAEDQFGTAVAISGKTAIVGAINDDLEVGFGSGSAYLFDVATGRELFKLTAFDADTKDQFGHSVAISGNRAIVGSPFDNDVGHSAGSAYLFDVATGQHLFKFTAGLDARAQDVFGWSVAISGDTAIVGAPFDEDVISAAYLFDVTTGDRIFKLTASDTNGDDQFGRSVAISGNRAIVGADRGNSSGETRGGAAYVFDVDPLSPSFGEELFKLTASDAANVDRFGHSVAISGNTAIIGTRFANSAYLFDVTTGEELFKLTASDAAEDGRFGSSVAISGNVAIVGAHEDDDAGRSSGSAYLFDVTTGEELIKIAASDAAEVDIFGFVGISGSTAIVGAPGNDDAGESSGSAYLFVSIPEPSGFVLAALALLGLFGFVRRRRVAIR